MEVFKDLCCEVPGTNSHYFGIDDYSEKSDTLLVYGYVNLESNKNDYLFKRYKKVVYFNVTMPTEFCSPQPTNADDKFDIVYTICPYSVEWLNSFNDKYRLIWYPFNELDIPKNDKKLYDVCYHGGIHGDYHIKCLDSIKKFNYRYMSMTHGINNTTREFIKDATDLNLSNSEKLKRISECKISVCYNHFSVRDLNDYNNIVSRKSWQLNDAFSDISIGRKIPQFKSRFNEAAFCKTLNLIKRDKWNVVEYFYKPDVDFLYFDSDDELPDRISHVLKNWEDYSFMVENAYNKSLNYTSRKLYERIKNDM